MTENAPSRALIRQLETIAKKGPTPEQVKQWREFEANQAKREREERKP